VFENNVLRKSFEPMKDEEKKQFSILNDDKFRSIVRILKTRRV